MPDIIRETRLPTGWEVEFRFDREFVRRGLWRWQLKRSMYPVLFYTVFLAATLYYYRARGPQLLSAIAPFVAFGYVMIILLVIRRLYTTVDAVYRQYMVRSPSGLMRIGVDDEGISTALDNSQSRYAYRDVSRLTRQPDVWLIEISRGSLLFFPANVSEEIRDFLTHACEQAGVVVSPRRRVRQP